MGSSLAVAVAVVLAVAVAVGVSVLVVVDLVLVFIFIEGMFVPHALATIREREEKIVRKIRVGRGEREKKVKEKMERKKRR